MVTVFHLPIATESNLRKQECGECQACCTALGIEQLTPPKPMWYVCRHQCRTGCKIYGRHPDECQRYECAWLSGMFQGIIEYRPDKLGLIIDMRELDGIPFAQVWEINPRAIEKGGDRVAAVLTYVTEKLPTLIRYFNGERIGFFGPTQEEVDSLAQRYVIACKEGRQT